MDPDPQDPVPPPDAALDYAGYLHLDRLLDCQDPPGRSAGADELLFIIQHQVTELWFKLILVELEQSCELIRRDRIDPCLKRFARIRAVQRQLFEQWAVLETLTPSEYLAFRDRLGSASGFQSRQYRALVFLLGEKSPEALQRFHGQPAAYRQLTQLLHAPSLYDEVIRHLGRIGLDVPPDCLDRDWTRARPRSPGLVRALRQVYEQPQRWWGAYALCERLVDFEEQFQLWRFRHLKTVERIIGLRRGTGGTSGVPYLRRAVEHRLFPELIDVRTELGS